MLQIKCKQCGEQYWIKGYSTLSGFDDPGEDVISEREDFSECCEHIQRDGNFEIIDSSPDDVYEDWSLDRFCEDNGDDGC